MRKIVYQLLFASLFVAVLAPLAAWAQTEDHINVEVPFAFRVGSTLLPAGKYRVEPVDVTDPYTLIFHGLNNNAVAIVPTLPTEASTYQNQSRLKFEKVGNQEILSKIWVAGDTQGYQLLENGPGSVMMAKNSNSARRTAAERSNGM